MTLSLPIIVYISLGVKTGSATTTLSSDITNPVRRFSTLFVKYCTCNTILIFWEECSETTELSLNVCDCSLSTSTSWLLLICLSAYAFRASHYEQDLRSKTGRKEDNVLWNDALNTFCLPLYGKGSLGERGNLFLSLHELLLYASSHKQDSTCHGFCYTNRG